MKSAMFVVNPGRRRLIASLLAVVRGVAAARQ
jgi:hypothetical protein